MIELDDQVKNTVLVIMAHVKAMPNFTKDKLLLDLSKMVRGEDLYSILSPEALELFQTNTQECSTGVTTTKSGGVQR